jgi:lysozyme
MTLPEDFRLHQLLVAHEGLRTDLYKCSAGRWTIGVGYNIQDNGLPRLFCLQLLDHMITECRVDLHNMFAEFGQYSEARQHALIGMRYNLGPQKFRGFRCMIEAVKEKDWTAVAAHALDSKWALQVGDDPGERAHTITAMLRTGHYPN